MDFIVYSPDNVGSTLIVYELSLFSIRLNSIISPLCLTSHPSNSELSKYPLLPNSSKHSNFNSYVSPAFAFGKGKEFSETLHDFTSLGRTFTLNVFSFRFFAFTLQVIWFLRALSE